MKSLPAFFKSLHENATLSVSLLVILLGLGVASLVVQRSTELRQRAAYGDPAPTCISPATPILGGVDVGGCRCPDNSVVNPGQLCVNTPNPTQPQTSVSPTTNSCSGSCVSSPNCGALGFQAATGSCSNPAQVCCADSCVGQCMTTTSCSRVGLTTATGSCGNAAQVCCGVSNSCTGSCVSAPSCSGVGMQTALGSCNNVAQVCCAPNPTAVPTKTPLPTPIANCSASTGTPINRDQNTFCCNGRLNVGPCSETLLAVVGDSCQTHNNCRQGLACQNGVCANPTSVSCVAPNGTPIDRNQSTYCCAGIVTAGGCSSSQLSGPGGWCQSSNNCGSGLTCRNAICTQCIANTCSNGWWCGPDGLLTYKYCSTGATTCDRYDPNTNSCLDSRAIGCRTNADCGSGYLCLRDSGDNTFACQPEQKTKTCYAFNQNTNQCENFQSFAGVECPAGSSPNSSACSPSAVRSIVSDSFACTNAQSGRSFCVGNQSLSCSAGFPVPDYYPCAGGCNISTGLCNPTHGDTCQPGVNVCYGSTLYSCNASGSFTQQNCAYGCDSATNSCIPNPANATYITTLEHQIENQYGVAINVQTLSVDRSGSGTKQELDALTYDTLQYIDEQLRVLPKSMTSQVKTITVLNSDQGMSGTRQTGEIRINQCTSPEWCKNALTQLIAYNTENVPVESSYCVNEKTCSAITGFMYAAATDNFPTNGMQEGIIFNSEGVVDQRYTDVFKADTPTAKRYFAPMHDPALPLTTEVLYAEYQKAYFMEPSALYCVNPSIYSFFQDMYGEYTPNASYGDCQSQYFYQG